MKIRNLTNSPQMVGKVRVPAKGEAEVDDAALPADVRQVVTRSGLFQQLPDEETPAIDPLDEMSDADLRQLVEAVTGKKPGPRTSREKLLEIAKHD